MEEPLYELKSTMRRDGLKITKETFIIDQRMGKDEKIIPVKDITEVSTGRSAYDIPFTEQTLSLRVGSKKYVIRRLPKKECQKAKDILSKVMSEKR